MKKIILLILSVLFLSACSIYHIDSKDMALDYYPSKNSAQDVIYLEKVQKPHKVIGVVTVNTERNQRISDVIEKMKREAAILGGDAITGIETDATGVWKKLPAQQVIGNGYVRANFSASVVVFE